MPPVSEMRSRTVSWQDPAVLAGAGAELSGREFLEAIRDGRLPPPPMATLIGAELVSVGEGEVTFRCTPDESTYNPIGVVHGGLLCTLLDTATGCAVQSLLPAGAGVTSIEIKVSSSGRCVATSARSRSEGARFASVAESRSRKLTRGTAAASSSDRRPARWRS
jgi:uncharacterized protein (TIGR00369 family)